MPSHYNSLSLPSAYSQLPLRFLIKQQPEDFVVTEQLGFEPSGSGDHLYLSIKKRNANTLELRERLAQIYRCPPLAIGYAGLKDKQAVCRQWFSIKTNADGHAAEQAFASDIEPRFSIERQTRNERKLRIGAHRGNHFALRLLPAASENWSANQATLRAIIKDRVELISQQGVPNYYGPQRFGHQGSNLLRAAEMFEGSRKPAKEKRSLYISAARSALFNDRLAQRVVDGSWRQYRAGDQLILSGSRSFFSIDDTDIDAKRDIEGRLAARDIAIGEGLYSSEIASRYSNADHALCKGLDAIELKSELRALAIYPEDMHWQLQANSETTACLSLSFVLPKGAYATAVLKEIGLFE